jgi:hypothetical protein
MADAKAERRLTGFLRFISVPQKIPTVTIDVMGCD